jgi:hypothetical protein
LGAREQDSAPPAQQQQQQSDQQQMRGLDEEVQEIKSDVLRISQELSRLEEKLLYPSGTQVAVFVELGKGDPLRLDAVRLQIDGQLVAHYIYSFKELEALRKGGVQRLYVGNVTTGEHQLEVLVEPHRAFQLPQGGEAEARGADDRGRLRRRADRARGMVIDASSAIPPARARAGGGACGPSARRRRSARPVLR